MKKSKAHTCFKNILGEYIRSLHDVGVYAERLEKIGDEKITDELVVGLVFNNLRLTVVGSVAAFDRYYTERFIEGFLPYTRKYTATKDLGHFLEECGADITQMLEVVRMQRPGARLKMLVSKKLKRYVTQNPDKIDKIYKCYGLPNLLENAEKMAKRRTLLREVYWLIDLRHEIVHQGHADRSGKLINFSKKELNRIKKAIFDLMKLVENCEFILQEKGI